MADFEAKDYRVFELFHKDWALVTAGSLDSFNTCTIGWGSLGTIWSRDGRSGSAATVYLHPARYTTDFVKENEFFTICFFDKKYKKALGLLGSVSGRDRDKVKESGLTPVKCGESVAFSEAKLTFLCRKLYEGKFIKDGLDEEIAEYYMAAPSAFPPDENGEWQPHYVFVGEIIEALDGGEE